LPDSTSFCKYKAAAAAAVAAAAVKLYKQNM